MELLVYLSENLVHCACFLALFFTILAIVFRETFVTSNGSMGVTPYKKIFHFFTLIMSIALLSIIFDKRFMYSENGFFGALFAGVFFGTLIYGMYRLFAWWRERIGVVNEQTVKWANACGSLVALVVVLFSFDIHGNSNYRLLREVIFLIIPLSFLTSIILTRSAAKVLSNG